MPARGRQKLPLLLLLLVAALATAGGAVAANGGFTPPTPHSPNAHRINDTYYVIAIFTGIIFLAVEGALVYQANHCNSCHVVNGAGMQVGPPLNGLASRRDRTWVAKHFLNPASMSPGSIMPAYKFSARDLDRITNYLMQLPKG